jgi:hypothetical protein
LLPYGSDSQISLTIEAEAGCGNRRLRAQVVIEWVRHCMVRPHDEVDVTCGFGQTMDGARWSSISTEENDYAEILEVRILRQSKDQVRQRHDNAGAWITSENL